MQNELFESFDRVLTDFELPRLIRALEANADDKTIWSLINESGFLDALVPEAQGGAGLGWREAWGVLFAAGRHGLPLPVAQTVFGRALLCQLGVATPEGALSMAGWASRGLDGGLSARHVQGLLLSSKVIVQDHDTIYLLAVDQAQVESVGGAGSFDGHAHWPSAVVNSCVVGSAERDLVAHGLALGLAVQMAGVADRLLTMTLNYANDRAQFGKPIGKFQAVQQQITEMAELVYGARMASQLGCNVEGWQPAAVPSALAKSQNSAVAGRVASIAHAVHAAIGVTYEYDLQLYSRRLYEWARTGGGADYWAGKIGHAAQSRENLLDFVREAVF